jgi:hypothetical protein
VCSLNDPLGFRHSLVGCGLKLAFLGVPHEPAFV